MKTVIKILIDLLRNMKNKLFFDKTIFFLEDVISMKRSSLFIFISMSLCNGFSQQVIPLHNNLGMEPCNASVYISSIRYIPLETNDKCLLNEEGLSIIATAQFFFIHDFKADIVYRFDARTGKFINTIGKKGQGPGEYKRLFGIYVDDTDKKCFLLDTYTNSIFEYTYDGEFQKKISGLQTPSDMERIGNNYVVNNDRYIETKQELFLINREGKLLRNSTLLDKSLFGFTVYQPFFFKSNDVCYYKNYLSDNIYRVDESLKKQVVWTIDCGTKKINPKDKQYDLRKGVLTKDKINISSIKGYRKFLFIIYGYSEKL